MKELAKKILKYKKGGEVEDWKKDLDKEIDGLSEEAKEYVLKRLQGKKVPFSKDDDVQIDREKLDDEIENMSSKGRRYFKEELKEELGEDEPKEKEEEKSIGELMAYSEEGYAKGGEAKNWMQGAVKKPGALRAVAKKDKLIKGDEKLSGSDLNKLAAQAKKKDNKLLAKRVALAKTFAKFRKK
tara:strand:- start:63 stop:614 length:552 start_codon:yes stop_codon:yes gene_type:complete